MTLSSTTIFIILFTPIITIAQKSQQQWLVNKFKNADSVILISHELVQGSTDVEGDSNGKIIPFPKLIIRHRLNPNILTEYRPINSQEVDSLLAILMRPDLDLTKIQGGCFVSRQAIILIKNNRTSYIDICFHCSSYETSKDLQNIPSFDKRRWEELEDFFKSHGLKYKLDDLPD